MSIKGIKLITVPVSDQDAAKQFYVEQLGFEVSQDSQMGPMRWLEVAPKGSPVSFALLPSVLGVPVGGLKGVQLFTDDLDGDCESLRADTHVDNKVMQHLLESEGFTRCGIIHVEDGTPRIAYQRLSLTQSQLG